MKIWPIYFIWAVEGEGEDFPKIGWGRKGGGNIFMFYIYSWISTWSDLLAFEAIDNWREPSSNQGCRARVLGALSQNCFFFKLEPEPKSGYFRPELGRSWDFLGWNRVLPCWSRNQVFFKLKPEAVFFQAGAGTVFFFFDLELGLFFKLEPELGF